jgi:hypothetical protein
MNSVGILFALEKVQADVSDRSVGISRIASFQRYLFEVLLLRFEMEFISARRKHSRWIGRWKAIEMGARYVEKCKVCLFNFAAFLHLCLPSPDAHSQVTLAWDASTSSGVTGYRIHSGTSSGSYQSVTDAGNATTYTVSSLQSGLTYYFAVTDYDSSGNESGYSNEVSYTVGKACTESISPISQSMGSSGGTGVVSVTAASGCSWTAVSNASWITITKNASGTGSKTVKYTVARNTGAARSGTVTIAGLTYTVNQAGSGKSQTSSNCTYQVTVGPTTTTAQDYSGSVSVQTASGCQWTASSNVSWLTVEPGYSGNGNGVVQFQAAFNRKVNARTGVLTVAGTAIDVTEAGQ